VCVCGCCQIVRLLLEAGSETDVCESKSRQSPLFVAVQNQLVDAVHLLIDAGEYSLAIHTHTSRHSIGDMSP